MREEYTRENYPTFGKKYAGEKAIISLTSWKARIDTVSKTLYSLLKQCPGFHIVLVLSEEEFPKMMDEMPANLKLFVKNNLIEILWVYKNYKSFKKWIFTADKYRYVPVISADDDCIYTCNYAQILYERWLNNKNCIITWEIGESNSYTWTRGPATLFPIGQIRELSMKKVNLITNKDRNDDAYYSAVISVLKIRIVSLNKKINELCNFHSNVDPLSSIKYDPVKDIKYYIKLFK